MTYTEAYRIHKDTVGKCRDEVSDRQKDFEAHVSSALKFKAEDEKRVPMTFRFAYNWYQKTFRSPSTDISEDQAELESRIALALLIQAEVEEEERRLRIKASQDFDTRRYV